MKNLKFDLFPTYVQQIHPANPTNPETLKFIAKFLQIKGLQKFKICPSLTRSSKYKKRPKMLDIIELLGNSYTKYAYKKIQICPLFTLFPWNLLKPPKNVDILEFMWFL